MSEHTIKNIITINGKQLSFTPGQTILEVAEKHDIKIPTLCFLKGASPTGACRICVVELEGTNKLITSCSTPAENNMSILTESPKVVQSRKLTIELLLSSGDHNCITDRSIPPDKSSFEQMLKEYNQSEEQVCPAWGDCRLQDLAFQYKVTQRFPQAQSKRPIESVNPLIVRDSSKCILCGRCVQACNEIQVNQAIDFGNRGTETHIIAGCDVPLKDSDCVFCGECVQACPVGALFEKKSQAIWRPWDTEKIRTTCPYCGVGCQQLLHVNNGKIVKVTGVTDGAPNQGRLCVKGRFGYDFIYSEERLKTPLIRENNEFREASWEEAIDYTASKFKDIIAAHGPDALAGVSCARSINEDSYQMQKFFRAVIGTNNIDHCARSCHAPTVAGLATSFGSGAMTNSFSEFSKAKMFLVIGSNMTEAHPVAATFLKNAVKNGAELIVVDPRAHKLVRYASLHVPIRVGSDIAFLNGIMHVLIKKGLYDKKFVSNYCIGFNELEQKLVDYPLEKAAAICGIPITMFEDVARKLSSVKPAMLCYTLGITEHTCGRNNVLSVANLQMLLGNMGMECSGVNPLRGQNNVQGACDMGALPNVFPGYQSVTDPIARAKFEKAWNVKKLPDQLGLMIPQMMEGLANGKVKALYIFGENLANSEPDMRKVERELRSADFLVCQDIFPNETTRFAHVVFPAAAWSENDGTFTNSERRVSRVRTASAPPGIARPNWWIFKQIAKKMGHTWTSDSAQEIWDTEISVLSPILGGIKYFRIENDGLQFPCPDIQHPGTKFLHKDGMFTRGKGQIVPVDWTPPAEIPDAEYPLVLSTGRRLYHYHTRTQTGRCEGLNDLLGEETADISIEDASKLGVYHGDWVQVMSRRGEVRVRANVTSEVPEGMVWMAFHFGEACANELTIAAFDPVTLTAEYKACAVRIEKVTA